jgi:hypothetical protein
MIFLKKIRLLGQLDGCFIAEGKHENSDNNFESKFLPDFENGHQTRHNTTQHRRYKLTTLKK